MKLPPPPDLGLPPKYLDWRPEQTKGILYVRGSKRRIRGLVAPTGSGKTATALGLAMLALRDNPDARILILTETKGLQKVYADEGRRMQRGLVANIMGALNYDCPALEPGGRYDYLAGQRGRKVDNAPCNAGLACKLRDDGCTYYGRSGALQTARDASIAITNYANWLSAADAAEKEEKFGDFDWIICDEAHALVDSVCSALSVTLDLRDVAHLATANAGQSVEEWVRWASRLQPKVDHELTELQAEVKSIKAGGGRVPASILNEIRRMQRIQRAVDRVAGARGEWVTVREGSKVTFKPVWPDQYCESHLLRGVPNVVMMSATLVPQTLRNLGLRDEQFDFLEMESTFPVERRPVYLFPVARMRWDMTEAEERKMFVGLDTLLKTRSDWRWLVHTVSYTRAKKIYEESKLQSRMTLHVSADTAHTVTWLKEASPAGSVVLTPAMHTGFDLPDDACRGQALVKIPFPDTRDPVVKARMTRDKKYLYYATMLYIIQAAGRPVRHDRDWAEMWILDSNALWFFEQAQEFMPKWFAPAVKKVTGIGRPPRYE